MKIRTQLLLVTGAVALLPLFGAGWLLYRTSAERLRSLADDTLISYTQRVADETDAFVSRAGESVRSGNTPTVADYLRSDEDTRAQLNARTLTVLRDAVIHDPISVSSAALFDRSGAKLLDTAAGTRATGTIVDDAVRRAMSEGLPQILPLFPEDRPPGLWVCAAVQETGGNVIGAIGLWYELSALQKIAASYSPLPAPEMICAIVGDQGRFLAHSKTPGLIGRAGPTRRPISGTVDWGQWSESASERAPDRVAAVAGQRVAWIIVVASPHATFGRTAHELGRTLVGLGVLAAVLSTAAALFAAARLSRPIAALATAAEQLGAGKQNVQMPTTGSGEVATLARTLDDMQRKLGETLRSLEQRVDEVRRSEQRLHQFVDAAPIAMILANLRDGSHEFNRMVTRMLGYTVREVPDRDAWFRAAYPDPAYRRQVEDSWFTYVNSSAPPGAERPPFEAMVTCRDGSQRLIEFRASRVGDFLDIACLDLTERRRAEEALRESEEKFSKAFRATPDAICISDAETGVIMDVNAGFETFFECQRDDVIGNTARDLALWVDPEDRTRMNSQLARSGQVRNFEAVARTRNGTRKACLVSAEQTEIGGRPRLIHAVHDITDRVTAEQARRAVEEQLRLMIAHAPEAIVVFDLEAGRFAITNPAAETLFGRPADELQRFGPIELSPEYQVDGRTSVDAARGYLMDAISGGRPVFEWIHRHADGHDIECEIRLLRLPDPTRVLVRGSIINLSERKRTERALRTLFQSTAGVTGQAFFDATVAEIVRVIGVRNAFVGELVHGGIRVRSLAVWEAGPAPPAEFALAGAPAGDVIARSILHVPERLQALYPRDTLLGRVQAESYLGITVRNAAGDPIGLVAVIDDKPMPDSESARLLLAITASRVAAEIARQRANADLERLVAERTAQLAATNAELEAFSYSVSHDLRAPLRVINGFARAVNDSLGDKLDDTTRSHLERIRKGTQQMGALIDDLLRLSRASRAEMHPEPIDLAEVAGVIVAELRQRHPERPVEFGCDASMPVIADPALIRILIENLLDNAWKYSRQQPNPRVSFSRVGGGEDGDETTFAVRDNGAGFDMRYAGKLFAPFQRLHTPTEFEGTGIGLATVRRIATRHGGRVWAEGVAGQGATFYFTLSRNPQ